MYVQVYRREVELIPRWQEGGSLDRGAPLRLLLSPLLLLPRLLVRLKGCDSKLYTSVNNQLHTCICTSFLDTFEGMAHRSELDAE
jgi:hypothetical protein